MADIESNVRVNIDTTDALSQLKLLQQQISAFQQAMRKAGADNAMAARQMQQNLANSINATGKFQANIQTIQTSAERFTGALEKNKLTMGEYFRYAGGASKSFGKLFKSEFETINQVARERVKELQTQYIKLGRDANGAMKAIAVKPLALDMENLGTKTQMAAQRQQLFNQLMKQGSTQLLNFGKNTQWAGRQLMVGFTVPLTLMGSAAAKAYMEIEKASISFRRVYGDINTTADETEKMAKSVRAMADEFTKYGASVADTMDMAAKAAAMGKTGADLLAQISQAAKLAVLGQVDQNQALETTISLTNAFGTSAQDLSGKIDFLNAVENQTVTSIEDLTIAIPKAAPVIQQLGGNVEDLTFFLTAMKEGGINASEGANALKSGLASLINPSKKASEFMDSFGISIKGIVEGNKGDVKGTVVAMAKALDTLDPLNRARAIEQMFGKFQFSRISTLFQNVIKEGSQASTVAGLAKQTAEELAVLSEREMKKISDSPMYKFQKSIQDIQAKLAPVGEAFLKAVTPIMDFVAKVLDGFNNLGEGSKQFITILVTAVAGIGPLLLMTFGLVANGVANIMKLFTNMKSFMNKTTKPSDVLGEQTAYMNTEQLRAAAIASSLDQAHAKLRQTFTSEAAAVDALTDAYRRAISAQGAYAGVAGVPVGNAGMKPKKYANGVSMVPGPAGAGDIVPALLSPGEAVIPAKHARKYAPVIAGMVAGNLPGFESGTTGVGMRQSIIGPMTQKQTEGMARTAMQLDEISKDVMAGPYGKVPPANYGKQITPSPGHSFPAFGVGGIYQKPDGTKVFVKPQMSLETALAEMRGTEIARSAHGLQAPKQSINVMLDPTDPADQRRFIVLESPVDEKFSNIPTKFTKNQYFKQLVASLLRGDKDLGIGNLGGNILADVGPAGVFGRASGKRALGSKINSMEEQAIINLLGVKGGAKRFFAESTADIAKKMTPAQYDAAMKAEIQAVMPKLQATIAGFGKLNPAEKAAYMDMQQRLQAGMGVDWGKYQQMHSAVTPKKYADGTAGVDGKLKGGSSDGLVAAMRKMSAAEIRNSLSIEDTHITTDLKSSDPEVLKQIKRVYPDITEKDLAYQSVRSNLTAQMPANINQRMRRGASGWRSPVFGNVWNGLRGKLSKVASMNPNLSIPSLQSLEDEIGRELASLPLATDETVGVKVQEILQRNLSPEKDPDGVRRALWEQAQSVGTMRTDLRGPNGTMSVTEALLQQLKLGVASWRQTGGGGWEIRNSSNTQRIGGFGIEQIAAGAFTREEKNALRAEARFAAEKWIKAGDWNAPMPIVKKKPTATEANKFKIDPKTGKPKIGAKGEMLGSDWLRLALVSQDTPAGTFSERGRKKGGQGKFISYDDSYLKTAPQTSLAFTPGQEQKLYNTLMQNGGELIPPKNLPYWMSLANQTRGEIPKFAEGTPGVSQSAIAAFGAHQPFTSAHEAIARMGMELAAKQGVPFKQFSTMQGKSKRSLLSDELKTKLISESIGITPDLTRDPFTLMETLSTQGVKKLTLLLGQDRMSAKVFDLAAEKYGIKLDKVGIPRDPNGVSGTATRLAAGNKDWKTFFNLIAPTASQATKNEVFKTLHSAMNVKKYANGVFSVPGPKGAGDVVPAMLSPGEAVIPANRAEQHRGLITQMIAGKLPGYNKGTSGIPGYEDGSTKIPGVQAPAPYVAPAASGASAFMQRTKSIAESVANKGLNVVAKGLEAGKNAVVKAGNKALTEMLTTDAKKADAEERLRVARLERTREHLEANNEEYAQLKRESDLYQEQKLVKDPTKSEQAQQGARTRAMRGMEAEMEANFQATGKDPTKKGKFGKLFERNEKSGAAVGAAYGLSAGVGMLTQVPGQIGQTAQSIMGPIGAATAAMSMIPGPAGLVVGGLAALAVGAIQVNENFNKIRTEAAALEKQLGTSNQAMGKFAEFSKKATATEAMDKRREASGGQFFNVVQGKTTFGESYMKTDAGKALVKSVDTAVTKGGGLENAQKLITNQLSSAIASGVMTPAQARSIAANLGAEMGNMNFGLNVTSTLTDIMGPNGENLKNEPLKVRMQIIESSMDRVRQNSAALQNTTGAGALAATGQAGINAGAGAVGGAVAGGLALGGAALASSLGSTAAIVTGLTAMGSAVPVIGTIAGALTGLVIAGIQYQEQIVKAAGAMSESITNTLEVQQQMVDSLQMSYEKRIADAKAAGDTAEAMRLQNVYLREQATLMQSNKENNEELLSMIDKQGEGFLTLFSAKQAMSDTVNTSIEKAYEGTGMEMQAKMARESIDKSGGNLTQEVFMKQALATKQLGINQANIAMSTLGTTSGGMETLTGLLTSSPTEANRALGLAGNIKGTENQTAFLQEIANLDPAKLVQVNDALELAQKTKGVFQGKAADAIINFSVKNEDKMIEFKNNIDKLKDEKEITIPIATKIIGAGAEAAIKSQFSRFTKYNKANKVVFLTELQQIMAMKGDKDMIAAFKVWRNEQGNQKLTFADYAAYQADRTVDAAGIDNTTGPGSSGEKAAAQGPEASILDPYVKMLREANNLQQKLTVGWEASYKAIMKYTSASIKQMGGFAVMMKQQGVAAQEIQAFMNGTEKEQNMIIDKKTGKLKKDAAELLKKLTQIREASEIGLKYVLMSPAERLARDNEVLQAGLDVIAIKEKKVNEKYDARVKALDEIGKIQEKNNQQQQDSMTLADALSKGDIAAAAKAALQAKQNDQKAALDSARASIDNARKLELEGIEIRINGLVQHREDLEKKIEKNAGLIAGHKLKEAIRQSNIEQNALKSAKHMADMLRDGKALSLLKPYNPGTGGTGGLGGNPPPPPPPAKTKSTSQIVSGLGAASSILPVAGAVNRGYASLTSDAGFAAYKTGLDKNKTSALLGMRAAFKKAGFNSTSMNVADMESRYSQLSSSQRQEFNTAKGKYLEATNAIAGLGTYTQEQYVADQAATEIEKLQPPIKEAFLKLKALREDASRVALDSDYTTAKKAYDKALKAAGGIQDKLKWTPDETTNINALKKKMDAAKTKLDAKDKDANTIWAALSQKGYGLPARKLFAGYAKGGMVYANNGLSVEASKYALGTDTIPAMLTPGEFVMSKPAVDRLGVDSLSSMNNGAAAGESVYNYSITVNANSSDANGIADAVLREIQRIDSRRIRSSNI